MVTKDSVKTAQVYIATTTGLVQVQSLHMLNDPELSSMMTINKSVHLSGVSADYSLFVDSPQGIIRRIFGNHAYRMNVAKQIDHGNSWQLGVFVAHYLYEQHALVEQGSDCIIIATGAINTVDDTVQSISALARKCIAAKDAIEQHVLDGKKVYFLVPSDNYKQPLPDITTPLTPVRSLAQLTDALHTIVGLAPYTIQRNTLERDKPSKQYQNSEADNCVIEASQQAWYHRIHQRFLVSILGLSVITAVFMYYQWQFQIPEQAQYNMVAFISENKADCGFASQHSIANNELLLHNTVQAVKYQHVCHLRINTTVHVQAMWLISPNSNISVLYPSVNENKDSASSANSALYLRWDLPSLQANMVGRSHYIVGFTQAVDAADKQSLAHYLNNQQSVNKAHEQASLDVSEVKQEDNTLQSISTWANAQGYPIYVIQQAIK